MTVRQQPIFDATGSGRASDRVLGTVAEDRGSDPLDLDQRLYHAIDPGVLDRRFRKGGIDGTLEFAFAGYRIRIQGRGEIAIVEQAS